MNGWFWSRWVVGFKTRCYGRRVLPRCLWHKLALFRDSCVSLRASPLLITPLREFFARPHKRRIHGQNMCAFPLHRPSGFRLLPE